MNIFVNKPNLPLKRVKYTVVGDLPETVKNSLSDNRIEILYVKPNTLFKNSLCSHADLQFVHLGNNEIMLEQSQTKLKERLQKLGFIVHTFIIEKGEYPFDCAVNASFVGKNVICKYDILDNKLKEYIKENRYNIINVNQGYSKCSVCIVDENSVITEDESINNACIENGIDVLFIRKGFVGLPGFDYGFIGGAAFKSDSKTLCFIGKVENHPDFYRITDFLSNKGITYKSLGDIELTDVGSVLPILE